MNNRPRSLLLAAMAPFALLSAAIATKIERTKQAEERRKAPITAKADLERRRARQRSRYFPGGFKFAKRIDFRMGTYEHEIVAAAEAKRERKGRLLRAATARGAIQAYSGVIGLPHAA